eukprot:s1577_g3.t1
MQLAESVVEGPWQSLGAWPLQRLGRHGPQRKLHRLEEQLIVLKRLSLAAPEATRRCNRGKVSRRIDSLEVLVHNTLAELVTIANEAGVPTGGKAKRAGAAGTSVFL